jgi:hypothetical protein
MACGCDQAERDDNSRAVPISQDRHPGRQECASRGRKKGSMNQRIGFRLGSGWIHHRSHLDVELWTLGIGQSDTRVEDVLVLIDLSVDRERWSKPNRMCY